jgi:predicted ATPase
MGQRSHHSMIALAPLDGQQVRNMVRGLAARHSFSSNVLDGVSERTGGVPLFVEEVTRLLVERGERGGSQTIPPTLQQSLMARLDRLGPAREVAQIGSVIGRSFSYPLVRAIASTEDAALQLALERLAEADILLVQGTPPGSDYRFKHALIQDAAYENLLKSRRQVLHRRIAETLRAEFAATVAAEPELLAHHFTEAGLTESAIEWWGKAGQQSLARSAMPEAEALLCKGLSLLSNLNDDAHRRECELDLQVGLGLALSQTQGFHAKATGCLFPRTPTLRSTRTPAQTFAYPLRSVGKFIRQS